MPNYVYLESENDVFRYTIIKETETSVYILYRGREMRLGKKDYKVQGEKLSDRGFKKATKELEEKWQISRLESDFRSLLSSYQKNPPSHEIMRKILGEKKGITLTFIRQKGKLYHEIEYAQDILPECTPQKPVRILV